MLFEIVVFTSRNKLLYAQSVILVAENCCFFSFYCFCITSTVFAAFFSLLQKIKANSIQTFAFCASLFSHFWFEECLNWKSIEMSLAEQKKDSKRMSKRNRNFEKRYLRGNRNRTNRKLFERKEREKRQKRGKGRWIFMLRCYCSVVRTLFAFWCFTETRSMLAM